VGSICSEQDDEMEKVKAQLSSSSAINRKSHKHTHARWAAAEITSRRRRQWPAKGERAMNGRSIRATGNFRSQSLHYLIGNWSGSCDSQTANETRHEHERVMRIDKRRDDDAQFKGHPPTAAEAKNFPHKATMNSGSCLKCNERLCRGLTTFQLIMAAHS
jgi:hypothetical protein